MLRKIFYLIAALSLILATIPASAAPYVPPTAGSAKAPLAQKTQPPLPPGGKQTTPDPMSKLTGELRDMAAQGGTEEIVVYVVADKGTDLSKIATVSEKRPYMDAELNVIKIKPTQLAQLAANSGVIVAQAFHEIQAPIPLTPKEKQPLTDGQVKAMRDAVKQAKASGQPLKTLPQAPVGAAPSSPSGVTSPNDWFGVGSIGAPAAWAKGYQGQGVNVAIVDTGVDFGHPDLNGAQATYPSGPYAGWPIAIDPYSMRNYMYNGYDSWRNYDYNGNYSWYAGVHDIIYSTEGLTATFHFNGYTYSIDPSIVALSKSGIIRWGVHPDRQLSTYVYDWVPIILLDTTTAGAYDTVMADLNFDLWFDNYDGKANKASPVLSADLGRYVLTDTYVLTGTWYTPFLGGYPPLWWGHAVASAPMTLTAGSWIYARNHYSYYQQGTAMLPGTDGADGIADVSGGMVYYIADGKLSVPGMNYLYPESGIPNSGTLVAFMLGSNYAQNGGNHGTLCASATVAQGVIKSPLASDGTYLQYDPLDYTKFPIGPGGSPWDFTNQLAWLKSPTAGTVQGPAPKAKIIALGNNYGVVNGMQGFFDSYTFLAYGPDGVPNSGDEFVNVVSMSFGDGSVNNDGWDLESRLLAYNNKNYLPKTAMLASSGNGGHGFGTVNEPGGSNIIDVGASTQYGGTDVFGGALSLEQINNGDVQPFSDRGPHADGSPSPHVTANGAWGTGDVPLNMSYATTNGLFSGDGSTAWEDWGGTSRAAPEAAGVMALTYNAYYSKTATMPTYQTAREILMSSADDLSHDVLMQGAGRVNADRATDVAGGLKGISVSPSFLQAGDYQGVQHDSFAKIMYPGQTFSKTFTVKNSGSSAASVSVGDEILLQEQMITMTVPVTPTSGHEDSTGGSLNPYYYYADYFVVADPSKTVLTSTTIITYALHGADLVFTPPADADLMQVQLVTPMDAFDTNYQDPYPYTVDYGVNNRYTLTVYDWEDRNGDSVLWADKNADGIVNPNHGGDIVDAAYAGPVTRTEISRFAYSYLSGNQQEVTVRLKGADRTGANTPNIVLGIVHRNAPNGPNTQLLLKVVYYKKTAAPFVTVSPATLSVPAGGTATFVATFAPPAVTPPGLYEGAITLDDSTHKTVIPTTVNVAVPGNKLLFDLGGTPAAGTPYDNGRGFGAWTWSASYESGDWRFFNYDANAGFAQQYLYVRNQWGQQCRNMPTWWDTLVWGPNKGDQFSLKDPAMFGPYGNKFAGGTPDADNWHVLPKHGNWWRNSDDTALPESRAWATLEDGLNQIQFRQVLGSGKVCGEGFAAKAGVFGVDAPQDGIFINTDKTSGSFAINTVSPVTGMYAYPYGFGQTQYFKNQVVKQGTSYYNPPDDLLSAWVYTFTASNVGAIRLDTEGVGPYSDLGLFLLYDANHDGFFNPYDNKELAAWSTTGGPNQDIYFNGGSGVPFVADGVYAVVVYGYYVEPGSKFNLRLGLYGGDGLTIPGANTGTNYLLNTTAGISQNVTINWKVPGPGLWNGYLVFAMPAEATDNCNNCSQGPSIYVPVTINSEGSLVSVEKTVSQSTAAWGDVLKYAITVKNNGSEQVYLSLIDQLPVGVDWTGQQVEVMLNGVYTQPVDLFANPFWDDWYDSYMRTAHWEGSLPQAYKGQAITQIRLTIGARVVAQPGSILNNVADLTWYPNGGTADQLVESNTVTTRVVVNKVFLPLFMR